MGTISELQAGNAEFLSDPTAKRWYDMMAKGGEESLTAKKEAVAAQATRALPKVFMNPKWMVSAWEKTVDIMEKYHEPGRFSAFIAYEWTSNGEDGQNLHRNIIFRDGADKTRGTPPLTTFQSMVPGRAGTDPESLWKWPTDWEAKTGGKALAIPHNANMSNGRMFREARYDGSPLTAEWAAARARWEPLVEIYQYKGLGEAHPALSPADEFLTDGIWDTADLIGNAKKPGDINAEYAREALKTGLRLQQELGTNPFKFGLVAGTDTHNALSRIVGRGYHILVGLPQGYDASGDRQYPTLYILDGGALYPLFASYYRYLRLGEEIPEMILVGISYGTDDWQEGNQRSHDYTAPATEAEHWGGAGAFQSFLGDELLPLIERQFRSRSDRRIVFGQSIGGQFVLYTAQTRPALFWGHIASNPALHRNLPFFLEQHEVSAPGPNRARLFVASALGDDPRFAIPARQWIRHWTATHETPWDLEVATLDGHSHFSAPPASFRLGLKWLFAAPILTPRQERAVR